MAGKGYKEVDLKSKEGAQALYKALGDANDKVVSGKKTPAKKKSAPKKTGK
jgi:hypothetical protein